MAEMMKQLTLSIFALVLGVAVLATNADPAVADRNKTRSIEKSPHQSAGVTDRKIAKTKKQRAKKKFDPDLDFATEAVWRNRRPEWFVD